MDRKRSRDEYEVQKLDMARCLMLLSGAKYSMRTETASIFECKTCNKKFSSFQALGGHRASHKRPRSLSGDDRLPELVTTKKPKKMHECPICGLEFSLGQALGGHMRRHRASMVDGLARPDIPANLNVVVPKLPVLKRSSSSKRVFGLDLNLTPLENDLAYLLGKKMAPKS